MAVSKRMRFEVFRRDGFRYFCGVAWRKVNDMQDIAQSLLEADDIDGGVA